MIKEWEILWYLACWMGAWYFVIYKPSKNYLQTNKEKGEQ